MLEKKMLAKRKKQGIDTLIKDTIVEKPGILVDIIRYKAKAYAKMSRLKHTIFLYDEAELYYQDTELSSGKIDMDYIKNEVYAGRIKDKKGAFTQLPNFIQANSTVNPDSIRFNFDTQKALIWNSRSEQQAGLGSFGSESMNVLASLTKKENDSVYFLKDMRLTSSQTPENPDYYIRIRKAKFVPKKKIVSGLANLYISDVPTPIALPFGYFPMTSGRSAGLIMPTFGNDPGRGYFLQNGGYYLPISDNLDLNLTGDIYSNGSYGFRTQSVYTKKYKYSGNINFRYENLVTSQKGFDDYGRNTIYNIQISHSQDAKANPTSRLSASVNLGSSQYFRNSLNQMNLPNTQNNNLSSSISYAKNFPDYPAVNMSVTASHNQNTNTQAINLTLPTFQASMERIYPFAKRDGIKKGILQNINFTYATRGENRIQTTDSLFFTKEMFKDAELGMTHSIPFNTNFKVAKYFSVSLGGNYEDSWVMKTYTKRIEEGQLVRDTVKGFDRFNRYNISASIGTTVYGTLNFKEGSNIQALRHVIRPSVSIGYLPSFEQFYDSYLDARGKMVSYTRFEGSMFGAPGLGKSRSVGFSLQNTLEAKLAPKDSSQTEPRKVSILNNLNFSSSYNFEADSLRLAPFNFSGGTSLFNSKLSVNFSGNLDPYAIDNAGRRINTFNVQNGGGLFRLTRGSANMSYSLNNDSFKKNKDPEKEQSEEEKRKEEEKQNFYMGASGGRTDSLFGRAGEFSDQRSFSKDSSGDETIDNPIYGTKIPWSLNIAYAITYNNSNRQQEFSNNSFMFSGDVNLTPMWKVGVSSGYDIKNKGFTLTQFRIERDLNDFRLNFDWTPFGDYERWYFFIGIKSSLLSDLKWEKRSQPPRR
jgi:lipopolysaccharide assembly outer membrane protein LptD (OstA)